MTQETEIAPGIFLTKRASESTPSKLNPEQTFLASASPSDQLEYVLNEVARLMNSNIMLERSNAQLREFVDDRDLRIVIEENIDVIAKQSRKLKEMEMKIKALELGMGACAVDAARSAAASRNPFAQNIADAVKVEGVESVMQEEDGAGGVYL